MAEVLGTVVGVVSLGMQVYSGISTYLDGIQCRKEDIESTIRHCESMETMLKQIASLQTRLPAWANANDAALAKSMASAETELSLLQDFVVKISTGNTLPKSVVDRIKDQKKRLLYPFRKDHLDRLENRLLVANKAIQTALQLAETETILEHGVTLRGVQTNIDSLSRDVSRMTVGVQNSILDTRHETSTIHSTLLGIETKTEERTLLARQDHITLREDVAEVKMMMAALMSPDARAIFQKLMSKPDALRKICDSTGAHVHHPGEVTLYSSELGRDMQSSDQPSTYPSLECCCNARRVLRRNKRRLGPAFLLQEEVTEKAHFNGCPLADFNQTTKNTWSAGVSFKAFRRLVSTAITVTTLTSFGAGGFGIAPSFTYRHVTNTSPAFRLLNIVQDASVMSFSDEIYQDLIQRGIKTLQVMFQSRKSSPLDIDSHGSTLLHYIDSQAIFAATWESLRALVKFLIDVGAPRDIPDHDGKLPFQRQFESESYEMRSIPAVDITCPDDSILAFGAQKKKSSFDAYSVGLHHTLIASSAKMANCHPLESIFLRNTTALLSILKNNISLDLSEVDAFGHTAFSHLVCWHEGLAIMLNRFGKSVIELNDRNNVSALECTLHWSGVSCSMTCYTICQETCPCATAVRLLLETDGDSLARAMGRPGWIIAMARASARAQYLIIDSLKDCRHQLKDLALHHLSPQKIDCLRLLEPEVLDSHTNEVLHTLEAQGVVVPSHLQTQGADSSGGLGSVYCLMSDLAYDVLAAHNIPALATAFYSRGFRDIDLPDSNGYTPLAISGHARFNIWLVEHGANLRAQLPEAVAGCKTMHACIGTPFLPSDDSSTSTLLELTRGPINDAVNLDVCTCGCSVNGCHPYTKMWNRKMDRLSEFLTANPFTNWISQSIIGICQFFEDSSDAQSMFRSTCLRACTFELLGLTHTCCGCWGVARHEDEDVEEIRAEEEAGLSLLETLLVEFEEKLDEMGCSLADFIQTYWMDRITEVRREMESVELTADELDGARELGVFLEAEKQNEVVNYDDPHQPAYWIKMMDALLE